MQKGSTHNAKTTTQTCSLSWKTYTSMLRYTIIFITVFVLFFIYPYIHFILHDSEKKMSEDGRIPTSENKINTIKEKEDLCEQTKNIRSKESDISALESHVSELHNNQNKMAAETNNFHFKLAQSEQDIRNIRDKDWEKEKNIKQKFENVYDAIKTLEESMKQQYENAIVTLKESMKQENKNEIRTLEESMKQTFDNVFESIQKLNVRMMQQITDFERQVDTMIKDVWNEISVIKLNIQQQMTKSSKESKENEVRGIMSHRADILQIGVIIILFIYIVRTTCAGNSREREIERSRFRWRDKINPSENVPLIISFSEHCKTSHEDLAKGFVNAYDSIVINKYEDIHQINAKVCIVFVDCDERNIILEGDREPQQIRKETVESIMKMGGIPVVIYHLHSDSRKPEGRCLFSNKLTSIQEHPILKELSSKDRVLSIHQQFSEYQISHLKNICNV